VLPERADVLFGTASELLAWAREGRLIVGCCAVELVEPVDDVVETAVVRQALEQCLDGVLDAHGALHR